MQCVGYIDIDPSRLPQAIVASWVVSLYIIPQKCIIERRGSFTKTTAPQKDDPMKVVTAEQMRRIDQVAIQERGIPGPVLMDRAGKAVAREVMERFDPESVAIVTGKGNNAGDGFVVARELHRFEIKTILFMLCPESDLTGDALDAYRQVPDDVVRHTAPHPHELREQLIQFDLVVDAIFGTGIRGQLGEPWAHYIEEINTCRMNVVAVDIPSGLPSEPTPDVGPHISARLTVTMGLPKLSMVLEPGVRRTGRIVVADIGFPSDLLQDPAVTTNLSTNEEMAALLPKRPPDGHKGTFGKVMILGGSEGMTGAAMLAAESAVRSGVGLVYSCYPHSLGTIFESRLLEPVKIPLAGEALWFTEGHATEALDAAETMQAVALGPGLGKHRTTGAFARKIVQSVEAPLVIDADGLNLLAENIGDLAQRPGPTVLTPHPGEAARLLGTTIAEIQNNRLDAMVELAAQYNVVVALKGSQTLITAPDGQRYINPTGNSGLAKGGSGDVLTGLIAGLLAQGMTALDAARLGVLLHGMAADLARERFGMRAMTPSNLLDFLGGAFQRLERPEKQYPVVE